MAGVPVRYAAGMYTTGADIGSFLLSALVWAVGTAITLGLAYLVIKGAVLAALREHTVTSNMGVVIVKSVPLVVAPVGEVGEPEAEGDSQS